ncbi:thiamine phosphate synthase [Aureispira]|nr:thiamine phosphate synthase [Aureispira sp.]
MEHRIISTPFFFEKEAVIVNQLFELGLTLFHLRKPNSSKHECQTLLNKIDVSFYSRIIVHQHPSLIQEYGLGGWHLKEGIRQKMSRSELDNLISDYNNKKLLIGTSVHKRKSLIDLNMDFDYVLISPVFQSISKPDYGPSIDWTLSDIDLSIKLIALGGVGTNTLEKAQKMGFREVAFLGAVWQDSNNVLKNYSILCKQMIKLDLMS